MLSAVNLGHQTVKDWFWLVVSLPIYYVSLKANRAKFLAFALLGYGMAKVYEAVDCQVTLQVGLAGKSSRTSSAVKVVSLVNCCVLVQLPCTLKLHLTGWTLKPAHFYVTPLC